MKIEEKLKSFTAKVMQEAEEKNLKTLGESGAELDRAVEEAERRERRRVDERVRLAERKAAQERDRGVAAAALEIKKKLIARRNGLTDELFSGVEARLAEFTRSPEYGGYLAAEAKALAARYPALSVRLRPADMIHAEAVKAASGAEVLEAAEDFLGGFIAYTGARGVFDNSFKARLENEREGFNLLKIGSELDP